MNKLILSAACIAVMATSAHASTVDPVAYFTFDNGIATDDSGNGNNGTAHAGTSVTTTGSRDGSNVLSLTPTSGTSGIETSININKSFMASMTMGGWIFATGNGNGPGGKFLSHDNGAFGRTIGLDSRHDGADVSPGVDFAAFTGTGVVDANGSNSLLNTWVHLAVVYDGANSGLYVNGVLDSTFTDNTSTATPLTAGLFIGTNNFFNEDIPGLVDDVFVYDRALDAADIANIFSNGIEAAVNPVPLPAGLPLMLGGLAGLVGLRRKSKI
jgi:hypothetical protein